MLMSVQEPQLLPVDLFLLVKPVVDHLGILFIAFWRLLSIQESYEIVHVYSSKVTSSHELPFQISYGIIGQVHFTCAYGTVSGCSGELLRFLQRCVCMCFLL